MWITFDCATKRDELLSDNHIETALHHTIEEAVAAFERGVRFQLAYDQNPHDTIIKPLPALPKDLAATLATFIAVQQSEPVCTASYLRHDTKDWHHVIMRVLPGIEGDTKLWSLW